MGGDSGLDKGINRSRYEQQLDKSAIVLPEDNFKKLEPSRVFLGSATSLFIQTVSWLPPKKVCLAVSESSCDSEYIMDDSDSVGVGITITKNRKNKPSTPAKALFVQV